MSRTRMACFILALSLAAAAAAQDIREIRRELPLNANGRVSIETFKGSVTVSGWDERRVEILARIESGDEDDPTQQEKIGLTDVLIDGSGGAVSIKSDYTRIKERRRGLFGWHDDVTFPLVRYTVRMPRGAAFRLKDHKSEIDLRGLDGDLDLDTYKGLVRLAEIPGVRLKTYKGEVHARFDRLERDSAFETYKGKITVELPEGAAFDLDADTGKKGNLDNEFGLGVGVSHRDKEDTRLHGPVNGGGPELRFETYKGSLRIRRR